MPYTATVWTDNVTQGNHLTLGNLETQYLEAVNSFEQDLFTPFVFSGLVCTKDGTTPNQLDVTSGIAFLTQSDGTERRRAPSASIAGQFTTSTPSTTYYLFLNNDGTWTWSTTSTGPANSLAICQATTDGSGNISTVTDKRVLGTTLLSGMLGTLTTPPLIIGGIITVNGSNVWSGTGGLILNSQRSGAANGISFNTWNGSAAVTAFSVGGQFGGAPAYVDNSGNLTGATVSATGVVVTGRTGFGGAVPAITFLSASHATEYWTPQSGGSAQGHVFNTWNGSAGVSAFSIGGQFESAPAWVDNSGNYNGPIGGGIPTTRNGSAVSAGLYTGTTTPTGNGTTTPATGAVWAKA